MHSTSAFKLFGFVCSVSDRLCMSCQDQIFEFTTVQRLFFVFCCTFSAVFRTFVLKEKKIITGLWFVLSLTDFPYMPLAFLNKPLPFGFCLIVSCSII